MRICLIPIDNRPVCYCLPNDIAEIDKNIELFIPPREYLGDLHKSADIDNIMKWIINLPECDVIILSLDTIAYGGLIPSRRSKDTFEDIKKRTEDLKQILLSKKSKIYAFSSIMRISNNNYNEEEKEYWTEYGKKIFEYSFNMHKFGNADSSAIPPEILEDYLKTRKRNFEINKIYLDWQKEGFFKKLIFSKDDCAEYGFNVKEAKELEKLGGYTKTGADEIPLTLFACAINKSVNVFVKYTEPDFKNLISNYEDVSVEKSVLGQLELGGFNVVDSEEIADVVLIVNNFREKQGELVMGWETQPFAGEFIPPKKPYAIADIRFANGADNSFVEKVLPKLNENFLGYSAWNTSANTLGSLLAGVKAAYRAENFKETAFKRLQMIRFLDDWAYQANVRAQIKEICDIRELMKPYTERLSDVLSYETSSLSVDFTYPWQRKFEIEVLI